MNHITIAHVHTRLRGLNNSNQSNNRILIESAHSIKNSNRVIDIKRFIESTVKTNQDLPLNVYIELFDSIIKNGSISDITSIGNYITENIIHKIRDSKSTQTLIKGRLTRLQHKNNNHTYDDLNNAMKKFEIKTTLQPDENKDKATTEAYNAMLEKAIIMSHCDRVLDNYNNISKRFNLDRLFIENTRINGVEDTVVDLCNKIDTYNIPTSVKFNTVIETAWYGFESNGISYKKSDILETAVDYFLFKQDGISSCKDILEATLFFDKNEDMKNIDIITEEEPELEDLSIDSIIRNNYTPNNSKPIKENTSFKDLFNKFKEEELPKDDKPENRIKSLINKLYSRSVDSIVDGTPDFLKWIRHFFIVGSCAVPVIGPVLMAVGYIADKFISLHYEREDVPKMIKCFSNEIKASKTKLNSTEDNEEKEKLKKYIKTLEDGKDKLNSYYNDLLSEKEQEERYDSIGDDFDIDNIEFDEDIDYSDFIDGDDDFDLDDDFLENFTLIKIGRSMNEFIKSNNLSVINETTMYHLMSNVSDNDLVNIATISNRYPDIFYKESVIEGINDNLNNIRRNKIVFESVISKAMRTSALTSSSNIMKLSYNQEPTYTLYEAAIEMECINEAYSAISIMIDTYNNKHQLLEASFTNTLKVASMKLKNAITKLSDKDRSISKNIDLGLNNFKKSVERALTNDNRESIIKGTILPSASKILKLGIVNAGLLAIQQPILAIIVTLGYLGTSAKFKAKERQMLIDEIEIELEMCEKYINLAEQKNDMKALKQLLTTKKELERQRQRIKYKMKVDFGQKYYDTKSTENR